MMINTSSICFDKSLIIIFLILYPGVTPRDFNFLILLNIYFHDLWHSISHYIWLSIHILEILVETLKWLNYGPLLPIMYIIYKKYWTHFYQGHWSMDSDVWTMYLYLHRSNNNDESSTSGSICKRGLWHHPLRVVTVLSGHRVVNGRFCF